MIDKPLSNIAASVRQRLLNLAKARQEDFLRLLTLYALELLLYRLSLSVHANHFTLKGALLFLLWMDEPHRRTKDLDLLSSGDPAPSRLAELFSEICSVPVYDSDICKQDRSQNVQGIPSHKRGARRRSDAPGIFKAGTHDADKETSMSSYADISARILSLA